MKLTDAQRRALEQAAVEPIPYWSSPGPSSATLGALVARGLLERRTGHRAGPRWIITGAGRAALVGEGK